MDTLYKIDLHPITLERIIIKFCIIGETKRYFDVQNGSNGFTKKRIKKNDVFGIGKWECIYFPTIQELKNGTISYNEKIAARHDQAAKRLYRINNEIKLLEYEATKE